MEARMAKDTTEQLLSKILEIIRSEPGVRPSEINRRLGLTQSDSLRATLIRRGLVRKVKEGHATHLYPA
jgi:Mn-dependent DtxR family transcriptional regulator